jgi:hypothetical protein
MIHLDAYEWDNEVFIRTWDTENPDSLMESVERPPLRITEVPEPPNTDYGCYWLIVAAVSLVVLFSPFLFWASR